MQEPVLLLNSNLPRFPSVNNEFFWDIGGNIGNSYITYSWLRLLGIKPKNLTTVNNIWTDKGAGRRLASAGVSFSHIFLCLQDHLRVSFPDSFYETALTTLKALDGQSAPMVTFSLAANTLNGYDPSIADQFSAARVRFIRYLAERCQSLGIRGEFTGDVLERLGVKNFEVVGCPSYFEGGRQRIAQDPLQRLHYPDIGVTGQLPLSSSVDKQIYLQGDVDWPLVEAMHQPSTIWSPDILSAAMVAPSVRIAAQSAAQGRAHFFTDFSAWKNHIAEHCILVAGARLHGAIVALNAGVPAIVGNGDARARESCAWFGIPWVPSLMERSDLETAELVELAQVEDVNKRYLRRFDNFCAWLTTNGLTPTEDVEADLPRQPLSKEEPATIVDRVFSAYSLALGQQISDAESASWAPYTPIVTAGEAGAPALCEAAARYLIKGQTVFINYKVWIARNGDGSSPLSFSLPPRLRSVAPTSLSGRETSTGIALQAIVDGDWVSVFTMQNEYPGFDGASLTVSGVFETE